MAFYIYKASQNDKTHVLKIVANESDIENLNLGAYTKIEVSESEYNNIRNSTKIIESYDGTTFTYRDYPLQENAPGKDSWCCYENNQELDNYLNVVVGRCNDFLEVPTNASNPLFSDITNYKNYIESFDTSSLTYPMLISWEKYCEDNSITYFNPLQIP